MFARAANTLDHLNLTASCNDFFFSGFAEAHSLNSKLLGQFAIAKNTDTVANVLNDTFFNEHYGFNNGAVLKTIEYENVDFNIIFTKFIVETAFRKTQV